MEFQVINEIAVMLLQHAKQAKDIFGNVIDDLSTRCHASAQEYPAHADERFCIHLVRGGLDAFDQCLGQQALAADIGGCWANGLDRG